MLNGINANSENFKSQIATDFTNSEQMNDSYEFRMFSLKEICPENSNSSDSKLSPVFRASKLRSLPKFEDAETNLTNFQSRRITEEVKSSVGTSITEFRLATISSPETHKIYEQFGASPCAGYCGCCKKYVHTYLEYFEPKSVNYFHKISQIFSACCGRTDLGSKVIVHKCPYCSLILGKVGSKE